MFVKGLIAIKSCRWSLQKSFFITEFLRSQSNCNTFCVNGLHKPAYLGGTSENDLCSLRLSGDISLASQAQASRRRECDDLWCPNGNEEHRSLVFIWGEYPIAGIRPALYFVVRASKMNNEWANKREITYENEIIRSLFKRWGQNWDLPEHRLLVLRAFFCRILPAQCACEHRLYVLVYGKSRSSDVV